MAAPSTDHIVYRTKSMDEVDSLWWGLMQKLGWDRGHQDLAVHWHVTPNWPVVAPASPAGGAAATPNPVGLCTPFIYDNGTGWVGFFILQEEHRGKGWGGALFQAVLDAFREHGVQYVGLDAVPEQKATYERRGFVEVSKIKVMTRESVAARPVARGVKGLPEGYELVKADEVDQLKLVGYEEEVTGFRRSKLWSEQGLWSRPKKDVAGFAVVKDEPQGRKIVGLAVIKDCENGYRLGPLYAGRQDVAEVLLDKVLSWTNQASGQDHTIGAEVNMTHSSAVKLFEDFGWTDAGVDYPRMWIDGKATPQQTPGGTFFTDCWAEYDAGEG